MKKGRHWLLFSPIFQVLNNLGPWFWWQILCFQGRGIQWNYLHMANFTSYSHTSKYRQFSEVRCWFVQCLLHVIHPLKYFSESECQLCEHNPPQWQRAVHCSAALTHLHCLLHPFLHPQRRSSWQALIASGRVVQQTSHPPVSFLFHPQSPGDGSLGAATIICAQQYPAW